MKLAKAISNEFMHYVESMQIFPFSNITFLHNDQTVDTKSPAKI